MGNKKLKKAPKFKLPVSAGSSGASTTVQPVIELDENGYRILEPTEAGKRGLAPFASKAPATVQQTAKSSGGKTSNGIIGYGDARMYLNLAMEYIRKGKFGKAADAVDNIDVPQLCNLYIKGDGELKDELYKLIRDLLTTGKSFYEYDPKQRKIISDELYDEVMAHWRALGAEEPTGIVPADSKKTAIRYPTLHNNMDKAYIIYKDDELPLGVKESDSIEAWLRRAYDALGIKKKEMIRIAISPKIDGVSVNATVNGNKLHAPQTRGDESSSMKIKGLDGIQITDEKVGKEFGIQFECFLTDQDMKAAAEYLGKEAYMNNRNAVAGLISRLCTEENPDLLPFLSFYPIEADGLDMPYLDRIDYLENFRIVPYDMIGTDEITSDFEGLLQCIKTTMSQYEEMRGNLSYVIDGMVITIADDENQKILGRKGRTNLYQIALKFDPENALAVVDHIEMDMGKKGYRTPQVYLSSPVVLGGARYDHIPMLSVDLFNKLDLKVGSVVNVHRVGDVIPSITKVDDGDGEKLSLDQRCPSCGKEMVIKNKKMFCKNPRCRNNQVGRLLSLFEGIKLDRYSDSFVNELIEKSDGNFATPGDLVHLDADDLKRIGMTGKLDQEFPEKFEMMMQETPDYVILGSFGIPDLGKSRARQLIAHHGSFPNMLYAIESNGLKVLELRKVLGKVGGKIEDYFNEFPDAAQSIFQELQDLYDNGYITRITDNFEATLRIGHTGGDLSEEVYDRCEKLGYEVVDGSSFDVLITASHDSTSGKMKKAHKKNIPIYTQSEFLRAYTED